MRESPYLRSLHWHVPAVLGLSVVFAVIGPFGTYNTLSLAGYTLTVSPNPVQIGRDGVAHATWDLGPAPIADAARVRALVLSLRTLLASLAPSAGPYR